MKSGCPISLKESGWMSETDEQELIQKIHSGDTDALAEFLNIKQRALIGYIDRQLGPGLKKKIEPEDIFQEASAVAVKNIDQAFDDPFGWMCRICEQRVVDAYRRYFGAAKRDAGTRDFCRCGRWRSISGGRREYAGRQYDVAEWCFLAGTKASQDAASDGRNSRGTKGSIAITLL